MMLLLLRVLTIVMIFTMIISRSDSNRDDVEMEKIMHVKAKMV